MRNFQPLPHQEPRYPSRVLQEKGKLIVTAPCLAQINYACSRFATTEWSGVLFYDLQGDIQDPTSIIATCFGFFPMDVGSASFTNFRYNTREYLEYMKANNLLTKSKGLIHSHHNMPTFFSAEDVDEMEINSHKFRLFVSLIVNNHTKFAARAGYMAETETMGTETVRFTDNLTVRSSSRQIVKTEKVTVTFNLDIELDSSFISHIADGFDAVQVSKKPASKSVFVTPANKQLPLGEWGFDDPVEDRAILKDEATTRRQILADIANHDFNTDYTLPESLGIGDAFLDTESPKETHDNLMIAIEAVEEEYDIDIVGSVYTDILDGFPESEYAKRIKKAIITNEKNKRWQTQRGSKAHPGLKL